MHADASRNDLALPVGSGVSAASASPCPLPCLLPYAIACVPAQSRTASAHARITDRFTPVLSPARKNGVCWSNPCYCIAPP